MASVMLFHHAHGLTKGVHAFAEQLSSAGHQVFVPDLYDGTTFDQLGDGVAFAEQRGFENLIAAGVTEAEARPAELVYAGFSLGALVAHKLAQTRPGAKGALFYHHGDVPVTTFGPSWPDSVDIQIHASEHDEWAELETVNDFIEVVQASAQAELFTYPGSSHLFADSSLPTYDAESAVSLLERTLLFLDSHG